MQSFVGWKSWALICSAFCAMVLAQEAVTSLFPSAGSVVMAQEEPAADAAAPADADAGEGSEQKPSQNYLMWFLGALGWKYAIAFLIISFSFVAFLVMNLLSIRRDAICPRHLIDAFEANLNEKKFQEAFDLAKNDESMLGQMLAAGMQNLQNGYDKSMEAMGQIGEEENLKLEQRLSFISLVGTISPMVGLLGTVDGMVASFQVIAISGSTPKPSELAQGVSMALITTLVGLWLAIPAIVTYSFLRNKLSRLTLEVGVAAERLMSRFESMGKK